MTPTPQDLAPTRGVLYGLAFSTPVWATTAALIWWATC